MARVVTQEAHREHTAAVCALYSTRRMQREHVKAHHVAGLDLPTHDGECSTVGLNVGQVLQAAFGEPLRLVVHEGARHEPWALVRTGHKLQRRSAGHRIDRYPHADVLHAVDVVVGLVLVPGRALAGSRLLHQHMVVVQPHGARLHQALRNQRQRCLAHKAAKLRDVLPVAEVLEEAARVIRPAGHFGARAGRGQVGVDAVAQQGHFIGREQLLDAQRAIAVKAGNVVCGQALLQALLKACWQGCVQSR